MQQICQDWHISEDEYKILETQFGRLCHKQAWDLKRRNVNNNVSEDQEDMVQEIRIAMIRAGSYYKRQTYIESCFEALAGRIGDPMVRLVYERLLYLWKNKTRHGANRQKFGPHQERILERFVQQYVPRRLRPDRRRPLIFEPKFVTYCKQITWNEQRRMGKKITRDKCWRTGLVSLSEWDCMAPVQ